MTGEKHSRIFCLTVALVIMALTPSFAMGAAVASLSFVRGEVDILKPGEERTRPAKMGDELYVGDIIRTKSRSRAQAAFIDGSKINIAQKSRIEIKSFSLDESKKKRSSVLRSFRGMLRALIPTAFLGDNSRFEIETPTAVAAVRGTDFFSIIKELSLESEVLVIKGKVAVRNIDPSIVGEILLKEGESTKVGKGRPPVKPRIFTPKEIKRHLKETEPKESDPGQLEKMSESLVERHEKVEPPVTPPITDTTAPVGVIVDFP